MVHNLVHNLCESLVTNIGDIADTGKRTPPAPITYLTQWKIVGNSEVHTLPYPDGIVLPNGYKRCEYLTFDGNSYIRPNITPAYGIGVNFSFLTSTTGKSLLGSRNSLYEASLLVGSVSDTNIAIGYGKSILNVQAADLANGEKHSIILDSSQLKIDGIDYAFPGRQSFVQNIPILLGGLATGDNTFDSGFIVGNIYDTIFYDTQGELWHGIPCLDANDVPCFFDIVSQTAFYNQGRGSFTYKLYPQPTEIWSCGEYSAVDGKWHILVQPQGGSIADIALTEPLRKVNDVADTIEFPSDTEGKALVTRNIASIVLGNSDIRKFKSTNDPTKTRWRVVENLSKGVAANEIGNVLSTKYPYKTANDTYACQEGVSLYTNGGFLHIYDENYSDIDTDVDVYKAAVADVEVIFELATPTTELVDAPQIEEADSYTCVVSQGAKAVSWSGFETE